MEIPILHIDAFTSEPFKGNPAAVCLLDEPRPAEWMQNVAAEMNLSETAFVVPRQDGGFDLRWFTPKIEVPLCGHATLASSHALWETGRLAQDKEARFHTLSGWFAVNVGVIITARGDSKYDFVSRYFACYAGIDEDPVTGAAHCMLAPYWSAKLGKDALSAYQASARGGEVGVKFNGDRVVLGGNAKTILRGSLLC